MSPWSPSSEQLLNSEEECSDKYVSEIVIEKRTMNAKSSRWHNFIYFAIVHAALLTVYTAVVFSLWPDVVKETFPETYSKQYHIPMRLN